MIDKYKEKIENSRLKIEAIVKELEPDVKKLEKIIDKKQSSIYKLDLKMSLTDNQEERYDKLTDEID